MRSPIKKLRPDLVAAMLERLRAVTNADPCAAELARLLLMPIEREDGERSNNLTVTLRAYYACGARVDKTANALFLHRNSVRYRLDRIRLLIGLDIDQPYVIAALTVALTCRDHIPNAVVERVSDSATARSTHAG
jgi:DNA-binding PucR family transcriptional regulator